MTVTPFGSMKSLFVWRESPCEPDFIPDTPARAFRQADGQLVLLASSDENWILTGNSWIALKPDCQSVLSSSKAAKSKGLFWIEATYSSDGVHVSALASRAIPDLYNQGCHGKRKESCWLNDIYSAVSTDSGRSFSITGPIASFSKDYDPKQTGRIGFFTTSNIVLSNGFYYAFVFFQLDEERFGNCLIRSKDLLTPRSWLAWDGQSFRLPILGVDPGREPCTPVPRQIMSHEVRSISYLASDHVWIAVFADSRKLGGDLTRVPGVYMATSSDLIHWNSPTRILGIPQQKDPAICNDFVRYPTLLDPNSRDRNFATIDSNESFLVFTYDHVKNCSGSYDRDLDYYHVRFVRSKEVP